MPQNKLIAYKKILLLLFIQACFIYATWAQYVQLNYKVVQNGNEIGWLRLEKKDSATTSFIKLESEVKKRILFLFSVIEKQDVLFQNGLMMQSHVYRKVNGDIKVNKQTVYGGSYYRITQEKTGARVMINSIQYNQLSLYFLEPVNISQIYSDNFERLLNIEKKDKGYYKIELPDGNTNYYYYTNGICSKVKVEHSLFTVEFILLQ